MLFHLANVLLELCLLHERLLIYHDKKAVISMVWYVFSHDSSAGDLLGPAVFQGPNMFGKPFVYTLRWWWEENSWTEIVFQRDAQHSLKIGLNSCFFKLIKFLINFKILSFAFPKYLSEYVHNLKYFICPCIWCCEVKCLKNIFCNKFLFCA